MLKVVQTDQVGQSAADVPSGSLLDELAREGARRMLAAALKTESEADVDALMDQLDEDGRRLVAAQDRWRAVNAPHLFALVRAGVRFVNGKLVERSQDQQAAAPSANAA